MSTKQQAIDYWRYQHAREQQRRQLYQTAVEKAFNRPCNIPTCNRMSHQVNHSYCMIHRILAYALEEGAKE